MVTSYQHQYSHLFDGVTKAQYLSDRFQIEMVGFVVTGVPDTLARAASYGFGGSTRMQTWWDTCNVDMALLLGDLETLAWCVIHSDDVAFY